MVRRGAILPRNSAQFGAILRRRPNALLRYEQAFHDYTQFSEVYDTTLSIELSPDKKRWLDDFALRGPAPAAAPTSWDKSPVANGAHYFLYGKIDDRSPGVLQESGFGVTFPNFIVDVQKDDDGKAGRASGGGP